MSAPNVVPIYLVDVEISLWTSENFDLQVALDEKLGDLDNLLNFMVMHFKSGQMWWANCHCYH